MWGWKAVFYVYAAVGLTWAIVWVLYSKDNPKQHKGVSSEELEEIATGQAVTTSETIVGSIGRSKAVWGLAVAYLCFTYPYWLFLNWLPTYLVQARGFTIIKMGFFASLPWVAAFISMNAAGWISDGLVKKGLSTGKARRALIYTGVPGMAVCLLLATQATNAYMAIALITLTMMFAGLNFPSFWESAYGYECTKSWCNIRHHEHRKWNCRNSSSRRHRLRRDVIWLDYRSNTSSFLAMLSVVVLYFTAPKAA